MIIISNKNKMQPDDYKSEPEYIKGLGWYKGYSFKHFWGNCHALLGDIGKLEGVQQLCHHYYLQNGELGANETTKRIKRFLAVISEKN
jgi:hypothetical protein